MSKIEVNTVEPQCGTTLTLGGCGQTVALGSGATQTGFGRTGTVDWITTPKVTGDSPVTGVTGKGYFLDTTAGTITINLPAGAAGSIVSMADYAATWQTYNVTVAPNGAEKIGGQATSALLRTEGQSVTFVYVDSTQGWVNTMDSTSNVRGASYIVATVSGACNTLTTAPDCANVKVATFLGPGTFCVSSTGNPVGSDTVDYMVVAGGGGGGAHGGAGGGAGGFRESPGTASGCYTASPRGVAPAVALPVSVQGYPIAVGGGGAGGCNAPGVVGINSTFSSITSAGGGFGGGGAPGPTCADGGDGGSGGGGGGEIPTSPNAGGTGDTPATPVAQGTDGGDGLSPYYNAGGGGGGTVTGTSGTPGPAGPAGPGGAGATTSISGSPTAYAGGGGGSSQTAPVQGTGGTGGGGAGVSTAGPTTAGGINTGGGGGGTHAGPPAAGGLGGSGIVIIRYKFQ